MEPATGQVKHHVGFRLKTFLPWDTGRLRGHRSRDVRVRARRLAKPLDAV
ncbi:hypothetical protein [Chamaesiphon sp. OTE_75_metabat_556]|nr:hypothetical protein [Chamaesiphon sp. OTE_75_metabat_556]